MAAEVYQEPGLARFFYAWMLPGLGAWGDEAANCRQKNGRFMRPEKSIDA